MNRREFIGAGLLALPALRACGAGAGGAVPLALATADTESHVAVVSPVSGRVVQRLRTLDGPRSIEGRAGLAICAHTELGRVSLIERSGGRVHVRRVLGGFSEPRYTALAGRFAFVSDSGTGEVATIDLERGRVVHEPPSATWRATSRAAATRSGWRSDRARRTSSRST